MYKLNPCPRCGGLVQLREGLCPGCLLRTMLVLKERGAVPSPPAGSPAHAPSRGTLGELAAKGSDKSFGGEDGLSGTISNWPTATREPSEALPTLEGYEVLEELGRGGMGVVYKVRARELGRIVALKMIRSRDAAASDRERFLSEARSVARLKHTNIAQIYELGEHEGMPYFTLEYCDGGSLADRIKQREEAPLPAKEAVELVETLARAIEVAHQHNVVHRDLTPGNILFSGEFDATDSGEAVEEARSDGRGMVGAAGSGEFRSAAKGRQVAKICDFGLAKKMDESDGPTVSGAIVGTPSYMSPEQASGSAKHIGPAADVYALGAIFYKLLTGRAPFKGPTAMETVLQVAKDEPVSPTQLQSQTPRDLETICLKCLRKDPAKRYASALALAQDLQRWQAGEPILARPVGVLERGWRWCQRNRAAAVMTGVAAAVLIAGTAVASVLAVWALGERERAETNAAQYQNQKIKADGKANEAENHREQAEEHKRLASGDKTIKIWDARTGEAIGTRRGFAWIDSMALSADGKFIATGEGRGGKETDGRIRIWDATHFTQSEHLFTKRSNRSQRVALHAEGERLVSSGMDGNLRTWDLVKRRPLLTIKGHAGGIHDLALSPDNMWIVTAGADKTLKIWDAETGALLRTITGHTDAVTHVAISPDGKCIVSAGKDKTLKIWDAASGREIRTLCAGKQVVRRIVFSPDGARLFSGSHDHTIKIWDVASGQQALTLRGHIGVTSLTISADGRRLVSADNHGRIMIWDSSVRAGTNE